MTFSVCPEADQKISNSLICKKTYDITLSVYTTWAWLTWIFFRYIRSLYSRQYFIWKRSLRLYQRRKNWIFWISSIFISWIGWSTRVGQICQKLKIQKVAPLWFWIWEQSIFDQCRGKGAKRGQLFQFLTFGKFDPP